MIGYTLTYSLAEALVIDVRALWTSYPCFPALFNQPTQSFRDTSTIEAMAFNALYTRMSTACLNGHLNYDRYYYLELKHFSTSTRFVVLPIRTVMASPTAKRGDSNVALLLMR